MATINEQIDAIAKLSDILAKLDPEVAVALANGGPVSPVNGKGVVDTTHPYWQAVLALAKEQGGFPQAERLHIAYGNVDGKLSSGALVWREGKVALQRRVQRQVGLGQPQKWAFIGGGFVDTDTRADGTKESLADAAMRHAREKSGVDVEVPPYGPFYAITKRPYGVTNEGIAGCDGAVKGGNIHGTVFRYVLDSSTALRSLEQSLANGYEVADFTPAQVRALMEMGQTTLTEEEVAFLEWLERQPAYGPERS